MSGSLTTNFNITTNINTIVMSGSLATNFNITTNINTIVTDP
jgi:hypothetical protein